VPQMMDTRFDSHMRGASEVVKHKGSTLIEPGVCKRLHNAFNPPLWNWSFASACKQMFSNPIFS